MRAILSVPALFAFALLATGCRTYQYRIVQPPQAANTVMARQPVGMHYDPLEYHFDRSSERLAVRISNPTDTQVILRGDRSFVVDPRGESRPVRGLVIGPRSFARMVLPPRPATAEVVGYYGYPWAWGPGVYGFGSPFWRGYYDPFMYGPSVTYLQFHTPYDWSWRTGAVQLHLSYERNGQPFEHTFEIARERAP